MLTAIEVLAVISGAILGVLLARRKQMDFVGVFAVACNVSAPRHLPLGKCDFDCCAQADRSSIQDLSESNRIRLRKSTHVLRRRCGSKSPWVHTFHVWCHGAEVWVIRQHNICGNMGAADSRYSVKRTPRDSDPYSDFAADEFRCRLTFVVRSANLQGLAVFFMG